MTDLEAIGILEDGDEGDPTKALQALIDSGTVWMLQGSYGRAAHAAIDCGDCVARVARPYVADWRNKRPQ